MNGQSINPRPVYWLRRKPIHFGLEGMVPEAIHEGGSLVVMPTVAGFLFALYVSLAEAA